MHIFIFIIIFREKVKNYFLFSVIFCKISHVLPQNPKRSNGQSANMAHFVVFFISFQKIIPSKIPPPRGGGGVGWAGVIGGSRTKRGTCTETIRNAFKDYHFKGATSKRFICNY